MPPLSGGRASGRRGIRLDVPGEPAAAFAASESCQSGTRDGKVFEAEPGEARAAGPLGMTPAQKGWGVWS
jgi:hypothetical protein